MGLIVNEDCFKGFYDITESCNNDLADYIEQFEKSYLENLLGCELAELFIADLVGGVPQNARFVAIFDPFCIDQDYGVQFLDYGCDREQLQSRGMKECITGLIYFDFVRDQSIKNTGAGSVIDEIEASSAVSPMLSAMDIEERWNRAIDSYNAIQYKINADLTTYPEFKGVKKEKSFFGGAI